MIPVHGKDVTVEDGTDVPAEPPVFNLPGHSDLVDQGLPSATSSPEGESTVTFFILPRPTSCQWGNFLLGLWHIEFEHIDLGWP